MLSKTIVTLSFFLLLIQFLLVYYLGDLFLLIDDVIFVLLIPIFFNSLRKEKILIVSLCYIIIKSLFLFFWEIQIVAYFKDLLLLLKPIIFFWGFYFSFEQRSDNYFLKVEKFFRYFIVITMLYGIIQFVFYFKFRISLPMQSAKYFSGAKSVMEDPFLLVRVASIYAHPLWFGYICTFSGVFYLFKRKYWISVIALVGVLVSFSRWALAIYLIGIAGYFLIMHPKFTKRSILVLFPVFCVFIFIYIGKILDIYNTLWKGYNDHAIKMHGIVKGMELLKQNPFGYGLGSFGTSSSTGSITYKLVSFSSKQLNYLPFAQSGIESFFTIISVQLGLDGLLMYFIPFIKKIKLTPAGLFFILLLCFPLISLYNTYVLILSAFFIQFLKRDLILKK